jgi:hypothetical protein
MPSSMIFALAMSAAAPSQTLCPVAWAPHPDAPAAEHARYREEKRRYDECRAKKIEEERAQRAKRDPNAPTAAPR